MPGFAPPQGYFSGGALSSPTLAPDGTFTAPAYSFASETTLGFFRAGSGSSGVAGAFSSFNAWSSATNFECVDLKWASNVFQMTPNYGSAGGTARQMVLGGGSVTTDVAPTTQVEQAMSAWAQSSTNNTGANLVLAGGLGRRFFTVVLFSQGTMATSTITITVNGSATVLTENGTTVAGSNWASLTSNNATATSIATAIGGVSGVTAVAVGASVYVTKAPSTYSLTLAKTANNAGLTATSGVNGYAALGGNINMIYTGTKQVALVGSNGILAFDAGTSNPASTSALRGNGAKVQAVLADESGHATLTAGAFEAINTGTFGWPSSNDPTAAMDTALARNAAGAVVVTAGSGTTATGTLGAIQGLFTTGTVSASTPSVSTSQTQNALSGTVNANLFAMTFADGGTTSTTAAVGLYLNPTINYTAASKTGSYTGLQIDAVETSLPTGSNYLLQARAGAAGTTVMFRVANTGTVEANSTIFTNTGSLQSSGTGNILWNGRAVMSSSADGVINLGNQAGTGFTRLNFGGTTSSFPSLGRSGTTLTLQLADGTGGGTLSVPGTGSTNGQMMQIDAASELLTLSTSGTTTDTAANLLPANSIILSVDCRVTTTITTATNWSVGDATTAARFSAANSTLTSGTTSVGITQHGATGAASSLQTAASKVRITTTGTPGAGAIRITVHYISFGAPTS